MSVLIIFSCIINLRAQYFSNQAYPTAGVWCIGSICAPITDNDFDGSAHETDPTLPYPTHGGEPYTDWEIEQIKADFERMFMTDTGAVLVSANQRFHRVRDASISMNVLMQLDNYSSRYDNIVSNYLSFVSRTQNNLGATTFDLQGNAHVDPHYPGPQISGVAIRVIGLLQYADEKAHQGSTVPNFITNTVWPLVKKDLQYLYRERKSPSYDFWGEIHGDHFMNQLMTRCAIYLGCKFADEQGDDDLQDQLEVAVDEFLLPIEKHYDVSHHRIIENLPRGKSIKADELDAATLLASLYTVAATDGFFEPMDSKVKSTVDALVEMHKSSTWPIAEEARRQGKHGVLMTRYMTFTSRPPYLVTTFALAEYYYTVGAGFFLSKKIVGASDLDLKPHRDLLLQHGHLNPGERLTRANAVQGFQRMGDAQFQIVRHHVGLNFPETIDENGGVVADSKHTWSYAAFFSAWMKRSTLPMHLLAESRNLERRSVPDYEVSEM